MDLATQRNCIPRTGYPSAVKTAYLFLRRGRGRAGSEASPLEIKRYKRFLFVAEEPVGVAVIIVVRVIVAVFGGRNGGSGGECT